MPSAPARLTSLNHPDAVKVINELFDTYSKRIEDVQKLAASKRISSLSLLKFGTIPANSCIESLVNILGASTTLVAHANPILPLGSINLTWSAYVSAKGQVKVRVCNPTTSPIVVNTVHWNILVA
jgi:hypothetical protein